MITRLLRQRSRICPPPTPCWPTYSSAAFRQALVERGITPCIPPHAKHRIQHSYDPVLYRQRHRIENIFARASKTGVASTRGTTDVLTLSCRRSPSPQSSSSGSMSPDPSSPITTACRTRRCAAGWPRMASNPGAGTCGAFPRQRRIRGAHGRRARSVCRSPRPRAPGGVLRPPIEISTMLSQLACFGV